MDSFLTNDPDLMRRKPKAPAPKKEEPAPKLKKYEACAALVEIRKEIEEKLKHHLDYVANNDDARMSIYHRDKTAELRRWLAAIEMAGAALTR